MTEWSYKRHSETVALRNLYQATRYNVSVSACNSVGCSTNTSNVTLLTKHTILRMQPAVKLTFTGLSHVELMTSNISDGVETYLELFVGDKCSPTPPLLSSKLQAPFSRLDNLDTYTTYSLRVQSTNGYSSSPWSTCLTFKTKFNSLHVVIPLLCLVLVLLLLAVLRALVKSRCPDVVNKLKQALEPKYLNISYEHEEWGNNNEVTIIHTKTENCDL